MSVLDRILGAVKGVMLMQERVDTLKSDVGEVTSELRDHERRLIRLETMIEMGMRRAGPPRLTEE